MSGKRRSPLEKLENRLEEILQTRRRLHLQFDRRRITSRDLDAVYESLFLQAVVAFETYCERMFFAIVTGQTRYSRNKFVCRLGTLSDETARIIVLQQKQYLDWLPWDRVAERCKLYFQAKGNAAIACGRPFIEVLNTDSGLVHRVVRIRNAIAHSSDSSMKLFQSDVVKVAAVTASTPAEFLRGLHAAGQTRLENYIDSLQTIAAKIYGMPMQ